MAVFPRDSGWEACFGSVEGSGSDIGGGFWGIHKTAYSFGRCMVAKEDFLGVGNLCAELLVPGARPMDLWQ